MYKAEYNKNGELKHSQECKMVFGRKDANCHRCVELLNGGLTRDGWQKSYFQQKKTSDIQDIRTHMNNCNCGAVCTYGEW